MRKRLIVIGAILFVAYGCTTTAPKAPEPEKLHGVASWYGQEFAGRTTANGEIFDPMLLTAAHRTLPFGTIVDVKNATNGQTVRVRVNDRGPYVGDRLIDLSYAAARQIGLIEPGKGDVDISIVQIGKGLNDDRYVYRYTAAEGFKKLFACPDFTGSYLSFDGENCYLSQWYKGQIHQFEDSGKILRTLELGEEVCGHTFVDGTLYVLRGREHKDVPNKTEEWRIARFNMDAEAPRLEELAPIPFGARSLTFDGEKFWSNHRAANETISFTLPS